MKVEPDTVLGGALAPPPPPLSPLSMAPPSTLAVLSINVELEMAKAPLLLYSSPLSMAPPSPLATEVPWALLALKVECSTVSTPVAFSPPPLVLMAPPSPSTAVLAVKVQRVTVRVPEPVPSPLALMMAPPKSAVLSSKSVPCSG
jgi:hypothetical protein